MHGAGKRCLRDRENVHLVADLKQALDWSQLERPAASSDI